MDGTFWFWGTLVQMILCRTGLFSGRANITWVSHMGFLKAPFLGNFYSKSKRYFYLWLYHVLTVSICMLRTHSSIFLWTQQLTFYESVFSTEGAKSVLHLNAQKTENIVFGVKSVSIKRSVQLHLTMLKNTEHARNLSVVIHSDFHFSSKFCCIGRISVKTGLRKTLRLFLEQHWKYHCLSLDWLKEKC